MHKPGSRPVPVQQRLHSPSGLDLLLDLLNGPLFEDVSRRNVRVLELGLPTTHDMIERPAIFFIGVRFRVVLVDPAREAGADEFRVLGDGGPVGVVFDLRVDEGHLLRAGDALVSTKHRCVGYLGRKELGCLGEDHATTG